MVSITSWQQFSTESSIACHVSYAGSWKTDIGLVGLDEAERREGRGLGQRVQRSVRDGMGMTSLLLPELA